MHPSRSVTPLVPGVRAVRRRPLEEAGYLDSARKTVIMVF